MAVYYSMVTQNNTRKVPFWSRSISVESNENFSRETLLNLNRLIQKSLLCYTYTYLYCFSRSQETIIVLYWIWQNNMHVLHNIPIYISLH